MEGGGQEGQAGATPDEGGVEGGPTPTTAAEDSLVEMLRNVDQQLLKLEGEIEQVEGEIRQAEQRGDKEKERQLREEKRQLREEKRQLREEKILLLERQGPGKPYHVRFVDEPSPKPCCENLS